VKNSIYNIRVYTIRFLIKICKFLKGKCYCTNDFYYETIKIKISEITNTFKQNRYTNSSMDKLIVTNDSPPNDADSWKELLEDIKVNGIKVNPVLIKSKYGYEIYDGNHRLKILEYLYGEDYEATVDIYLYNEKYISPYIMLGMIDQIHEEEVRKNQINKKINWKTYEA